jgi:hypothetical protein
MVVLAVGLTVVLGVAAGAVGAAGVTYAVTSGDRTAGGAAGALAAGPDA